jgi:hypothetical protein
MARCALQPPLTARRSRQRVQNLLWPGKPSVQRGLRHAAAAVAAPQQPGQRTNAITIVKDRLCACQDRNRGRHPGGGQAEGHAQPGGQAQRQRQQQQQQEQEQLEEQQQGQQQAQVRVKVHQTCCWAPNAAWGGRPVAGACASAAIVLLDALTVKGGPSQCGSDRAIDGKLSFAFTFQPTPLCSSCSFQRLSGLPPCNTPYHGTVGCSCCGCIH